MRTIDADELARLFSFPDLIAALRNGFGASFVTPVRHHHTIRSPEGADATLLLMPAWNDPALTSAGSCFLGVKIVTVHPGNSAHGRPSVSGCYVLMSGTTGEALATIDGGPLTNWRTAAASALAADFLARPDSTRLLMVGAGALAPFLIEAHATVRPIAEVQVWNRDPQRAARLATSLAGRRYSVQAAEDLERAIGWADVISCATLATDPLVRGTWLKPGTHVDLVGAFTPAMRESDDEAMRRATVFVDTRAGAFKEAGDIIQAGMSESAIRADLCELCRGQAPGRTSADEITIFKSVGTALEDLAAAVLAYSRAGGT